MSFALKALHRTTGLVGTFFCATVFVANLTSSDPESNPEDQPPLLHEKNQFFVLAEEGNPDSFNTFFINMQYIIDHGDAEKNYYKVDWNANDSFVRTMHELTESVYQEALKSDTLVALLGNYDILDLSEKTLVERDIHLIVDEMVDRVPAFSTYRTTSHRPNTTTINETVWLNKLSYDIDNGTNHYRFDCGIMGVVQGILMTKVHQKLLKNLSSEPSLKNAPSYFLQGGKTHVAEVEEKQTYHGWLVSSATGNIIEATFDPSSDKDNQDNGYHITNYSFSDIASDVPIIISDTGKVYGGYLFTESELKKAKQDKKNADIMIPEQYHPDLQYLIPDIVGAMIEQNIKLEDYLANSSEEMFLFLNQTRSDYRPELSQQELRETANSIFSLAQDMEEERVQIISELSTHLDDLEQVVFLYERNEKASFELLHTTGFDYIRDNLRKIVQPGLTREDIENGHIPTLYDLFEHRMETIQSTLTKNSGSMAEINVAEYDFSMIQPNFN